MPTRISSTKQPVNVPASGSTEDSRGVPSKKGNRFTIEDLTRACKGAMDVGTLFVDKISKASQEVLAARSSAVDSATKEADKAGHSVAANHREILAKLAHKAPQGVAANHGKHSFGEGTLWFGSEKELMGCLKEDPVIEEPHFAPKGSIAEVSKAFYHSFQAPAKIPSRVASVLRKNFSLSPYALANLSDSFTDALADCADGNQAAISAAKSAAVDFAKNEVDKALEVTAENNRKAFEKLYPSGPPQKMRFPSEQKLKDCLEGGVDGYLAEKGFHEPIAKAFANTAIAPDDPDAGMSTKIFSELLAHRVNGNLVPEFLSQEIGAPEILIRTSAMNVEHALLNCGKWEESNNPVK